MFKDAVRSIIIDGQARQYEFFEWFHDACETSELPKTERHYILNRLGLDFELYDDWADWE